MIMTKMDDFLYQVAYEKAQHEMANEFYKKEFKAIDITRWDWKDRIGREMQQKDIDCSITVDKGKYCKGYNISEKFRRDDWGDVLIELYSMYPTKAGSSVTQEDVDVLAYFISDEKVYIVNAKQLKEVAIKLKNYFDEFNLIDKLKTTGSATVNYKISDKQYDVKFVYPETKRPDITWHGVCAAVPWELLKDIYVDFEIKNL